VASAGETTSAAAMTVPIPPLSLAIASATESASEAVAMPPVLEEPSVPGRSGLVRPVVPFVRRLRFAVESSSEATSAATSGTRPRVAFAVTSVTEAGSEAAVELVETERPLPPRLDRAPLRVQVAIGSHAESAGAGRLSPSRVSLAVASAGESPSDAEWASAPSAWSPEAESLAEEPWLLTAYSMLMEVV
jgi:hypothetical protein